MTTKKIYLICGLVFLFISLIGLAHKIDVYKTQLYGKLIKVEITFVPKCNFANDIFYHIRFKYFESGEYKEYSKEIGGRLCDEIFVGQIMILKADLKKRIFLFEKEDIRIQFYSMGILGVVGLICLILGLKKTNGGVNR
ncbi:MAG: hypothetical protein WCK02_07260 [Bacteroidota bacterium]